MSSEEVRWTDDAIRWDADEFNSGGDDEELNHLFDPFKDNKDTFRYNFEVDNHSIAIELEGYKEDADEIYKSTGLTIWKASTHLCHTLVDRVDWIRQQSRILELGAGLGLCGILAHRIAPSVPLILTDGDTECLKVLRRNVQKHQTSETVQVKQLLWGEETAETFREQYQTFSLIIASDIIYAKSIIPLLWSTIITLLDDQGVFLMTFARRRVPVSLEYVLESAAERGFRCKGGPNENDSDIFTYEFQRM